MTDTPPDAGVSPAVRSADANGQLIVALAVVVSMVVIAMGLMITAYLLSNWNIAALAVGTIIGSLATALNAPTGIANALRAASTKPPAS